MFQQVYVNDTDSVLKSAFDARCNVTFTTHGIDYNFDGEFSPLILAKIKIKIIYIRNQDGSTLHLRYGQKMVRMHATSFGMIWAHNHDTITLIYQKRFCRESLIILNDFCIA